MVLELFRFRPTLVVELLAGALRYAVPEHTHVYLASDDLNDYKPTEYRADAVIHQRKSIRTGTCCANVAQNATWSSLLNQQLKALRAGRLLPMEEWLRQAQERSHEC